MRTALLLLALLLASPVARAQAPASPDARSPRRAVLLSSVGTAGMFVPVVNLVAIPAGPALGHFYAGNTRQAWTGVAIRSGALAVAVGALIGEGFSCLGGCGPDEGGRLDGEQVAIGAVAVILGSAAYDVVTAPASARAYNRHIRLQASVLPVVAPDGGGVRLAVRF